MIVCMHMYIHVCKCVWDVLVGGRENEEREREREREREKGREKGREGGSTLGIIL